MSGSCEMEVPDVKSGVGSRNGVNLEAGVLLEEAVRLGGGRPSPRPRPDAGAEKIRGEGRPAGASGEGGAAVSTESAEKFEPESSSWRDFRGSKISLVMSANGLRFCWSGGYDCFSLRRALNDMLTSSRGIAELRRCSYK